MKSIEELALKVAGEMWNINGIYSGHPLSEMQEFATRFLAAYAEQQEPVAWVPQFSWQRSIDATACKSKRSFDDIPLYTADQLAQVVQQRDELLKSMKYLQEYRLWSNGHAKAIIDSAIAKVQS